MMRQRYQCESEHVTRLADGANGALDTRIVATRVHAQVMRPCVACQSANQQSLSLQRCASRSQSWQNGSSSALNDSLVSLSRTVIRIGSHSVALRDREPSLLRRTELPSHSSTARDNTHPSQLCDCWSSCET